jgi:O-antigen/teichoic acid export membrane protein
VINNLKSLWVNEKALIYKNTFFLATNRVLGQVLSMVVIIAITRKYGEAFYGQFAFILAYVNMFAIMAEFGLQTLIVREAANAKDRASTYFWSALVLGLATSVVSIAVINYSVSIKYFTDVHQVNLCLRLMSVYIVMFVTSYVFDGVFMAFEKMQLILYKDLSFHLIRITGTLVLVLSGLGLIYIISLHMLSFLLCLIASVYLFNKHIGKLTFKIDRGIALFFLKRSPTFLLITIVSMLPWRFDIMMLTKMLPGDINFVQVGIYTVAQKLFLQTMFLPHAYLKSSFPQLSRLFRSDPEEFKKMSNTLIKYLCIFLFSFVAIIYPLIPLPIKLLFGERFADSVPVLRILICGLIPWGIARVFAYFLMAAGKQKFDLLAGSIAVTLNIILNLALIPKMHAYGAAFATLSSLSLFCVMSYWFAQREVYKPPLLKLMALPILLGVIVRGLVFIAMINLTCAIIVLSTVMVAMLVVIKNYKTVFSTLGAIGTKKDAVLVKD